MSFSVQQTGSKKIARALLRIRQTAPRMMREVSKDANRRHAAAYRRRRIPRDTGRLQASLTAESHPDRFIIVQQKGIRIGTDVPYARYQEHRIRRLTRDELVDIFIHPIMETLSEILAGRR
tara:strand:- start:684 stop:1046 length:363 start_codon:yes stop_codon:yes gene_type:complete